MNSINEFFWLIAQTWLFVGLLAAAVSGLWSMLLPESFLKFEKRMNRPSSIDLSMLDKPHDVDRLIYRHHVLMGVLISLFSVVILFFMVFSLDRQTFQLNAWFGEGFWTRFIADSMLGLIYFVVILTLYFGCIVLVRPSALRKIELWTNRWLSPKIFTQKSGATSHKANYWVEKNPRLFGGVVLILVILIVFSVNFFKLY